MARQEWKALHEPVVRVEVAQNYGEILLLHDAASRDHRAVIADTCSAMGIEPRKLDSLPQRAEEFLRDAVAAARSAMREDAAAAAKKERRDPQVNKGPYPCGVEVIQFQDQPGALMRLLQAGFGLPMRGTESDAEATRGAAARSDSDASKPRTAAQLLPAAATVDLDAARQRLWAPVEVRKRPVGLLVQSASGELVTAARRAAPALREGKAARVSTLREQPQVQPAQALRACVQAIAAAPSTGTATEKARAAVRAHEQRGALIVAQAAPARGGADGLDEVRALMLERSMKALALNEDGLGVTSNSDELLRGLLGAAQRAFERRFARSTIKLDKSYWRFWTQWCATLGTPALRSNAAANSGAAPVLHEREVAIALGAFMSWTGESPQFKVSSMLARLRGVARRHKSVGLSFVSLSMVVMAAEGLVQEQIDAHGVDSLRP